MCSYGYCMSLHLLYRCVDIDKEIDLINVAFSKDAEAELVDHYSILISSLELVT